MYNPAPALLLLQSANSFTFALPLILMFGIMYFLLFLPMQRQKQKTAKMLEALKAGDKVVTSGGIVGVITGLDKDTVVIRVKPQDVKLEVSRASVSGVVTEPVVKP